MVRFPAFPPSQCLIRILAAFCAIAAVPTHVFGQTTENAEETTTVHAEQITGRPDREVFLERDVQVDRGPTTVTSDRANYDIVDDRVEAYGDIRMRRNGDRYTGDELKLRMESGEGYVTHPTYHLQQNNAQGKAERIDFESQEEANVINGSYSTCEGPDPDWYLKASTMHLDTGRDRGVARKAIVYFKDIPILGTPLMSFPLSDARKSGFLPPTIGTTNKGGLEVTVPYYLNIAPNRDLTLYPKVYSQRGLQLGADARYLGINYTGETKLETMFNDRLSNSNRYALSSVHTHALSSVRGLSYAWNINAASDDNYPNDFPSTITAASQRLLLRDLSASYSRGFWTSTARVSGYQVLQDPNAPIGRPYDRLPQIVSQYARYDMNGFDWRIDADFTRFWHPEIVRGDRMFVNSRVSYPVIGLGYFLTPSVSLDATRYNIINQNGSVYPRDVSRVLPTVSLDSGLVFERDAHFFGRPMTQTLEPRLFYVYTPYRNQDNIPIFDSGEAGLSFSQLFSENRFVGHDRISDANQITAALVSRYLESDGAERMRLAIGQRFYLSEQKVTGTPVNNRTDLLLLAYGRISKSLEVEGNFQYSQTLHKTTRANTGARWQPAPGKVLNLQYRRDLPTNLEQIDISTQWPLARRWYGVGRVNYSLPDRQVAESLLGLEYKADCWVFRVVAQRIPTAAQKATSALFFQLELNGLTRLGSNPLDALKTSIPGYQLINQPSNPR
jgi:LPS-assembly protein